jgi:hypothetical protein
VVSIHNAVWVRTPCSLIHGYECFGEQFWVCLYRLLEDGRQYVLTETSVLTSQTTGSHNSEL